MPTAIPFLVLLLKSSRAGLHPVARGPSSMFGACTGKYWITSAAPRPQRSLGGYDCSVMVRASERSWPWWVDEAEGAVELLSGHGHCQSDHGLGLSTAREPVDKLDGHVATANERKNGLATTSLSSPGYPVDCRCRSDIHRKDGARELKTMRDRGASTIARDRASCDVNGMPGEAAALQVGAQIADQRSRIVRSRNECGTTS